MEQIQEQKSEHVKSRYDKTYKLIILIPALMLLFSVIYLVSFYNTNHDIFKKDISLKGGTSITVYSQTDITKLTDYLSSKFSDFNIREISNLNTGKQEAFIIEVEAQPEEAKKTLEDYLGFTLDNKNSSIEFTGTSIGEGFYKQAMFSILLAFSLMGAVIFLIFAKGWKIKFLVVLLVLIPMFMFAAHVSINILFYIIGILLIVCFFIYFKFNMPSFFVIFCALADMLMTLTIVNLLGIRVSTAGIVAFLMLIGYSVDSDILLTTRVLRQSEGTINSRIGSAFKTGIIMTLTSLAAVVVSLIIVGSYSPALKQIFTILTIGLVLDILNTWITNASLIKFYAEKIHVGER